LTDRGDISAQPCLLFGGATLLGARGLEFLLPLLESLRRRCGILYRRYRGLRCGGQQARPGNKERERHAGEPAADGADTATEVPRALHMFQG
jgi:hypothetical protein